MKKKLLWVFDVTMSAFKYFLGAAMVWSGFDNIIEPTAVVTGASSFIYASKTFLVCFGIYLIIAGLMLIVGKATSRRRIVGASLMMIYIAFVFSTISQALAGLPWVFYSIMSVVLGLLYLRWKYHKFYSVRAREEIASEQSSS